MARPRRSRIRRTRVTVRRDRLGRFVARRGRPGVVKIPRPPSRQSGLPRFVVLADGTRLLTTSKEGRAALPLLEFLQDRGLLLPELVRLDDAKRIVDRTYQGREPDLPEEWEDVQEPDEEDIEEPIDEPDLDVIEAELQVEMVSDIVRLIARSDAARKGWATRRQKARRRSAAARKGWRTRRAR